MTGRQKLIIDTDIGDDIDDAFALALALSSPEVDLLAVTTATGDTALRARLALRLLRLGGRGDILVGVGAATPPPARFTQARFAEGGPAVPAGAPGAAELILRTAAAHPGEVTLLAIGPPTNVAAAMAADPAGFRRLARVVVMGGSIRRGYELPSLPPRRPAAEHNFRSDPAAAAALFESGAEIHLLPLDATMLTLDEPHMRALYAHGSPLTDALALLHWQWGRPAPTLFDPVALAYAVDPGVCAAEPLRIAVDAEGYSRVVEGSANATVCLDRDGDACLRFILRRLMGR